MLGAISKDNVAVFREHQLYAVLLLDFVEYLICEKHYDLFRGDLADLMHMKHPTIVNVPQVPCVTGL